MAKRKEPGTQLGRYEADNQELVPIVVECVLDPYVFYRLPWERPGVARPVLTKTFQELLALGYKHVPTKEDHK